MAGPVQIEMERKLRQAFEPTHLEVVNESYKHCVPKDSETHFKVKPTCCGQCTNQLTCGRESQQVVIVSEKFGGVLLLERHRYRTLLCLCLCSAGFV